MRRACLVGITLFLGVAGNVNGIGTAFLTIPTNPRELALGGSNASLAGDPALWRGNPALIVQSIPAREVYFDYNSWFLSAKGSTVLVTQPLLRGTFGFGMRHMGMSDLELRSDVPTDDYIARFAVSGTAVEGIWGRQLGPQLRIGGAVRWIWMDIDTRHSYGVGVDLGIWTAFLGNRISLGASVQNLGYMSELVDQRPSLPTAIHVGVTYRSGLPAVTLGVEKTKTHGLVTRVAGEVSFGPIRFTLGTRLSRQVTSVAGSVNLRWRRFEVGYGLAMGSHQLGIPHLFHVKVTVP